jgi:ribulose-phosphate 3-epimerase
MIIVPAILTNDLGEFTTLIAKAEKATNRVQIDVIDDKFSNNKTVDPELLKNISTFLSFDFHLMVSQPIDWINKCINKETNTLIGQIEMMKDQNEFVDKVKEAGSLAGLGVDLDTPIEKLNKDALLKIDLILLMSVKAGFGGQEFDLATWDKIKEVVELRKQLNAKFKITVDGGITKEIVNQMKNYGVDEVYVGRRIFEPDLRENLKQFDNG